MAHDKFKEDMILLPQNVTRMNKYDEFEAFEKREL
jgi:hypothetical protein